MNTRRYVLLLGVIALFAFNLAKADADARFRHLFAGAGEARSDDQFGSQIAISGDRAIIGMPGDETTGNSNVGAAILYQRVNDVWEFERKFLVSDLDTGAGFGSAVAVHTDIVVMGAPRADLGANADQGLVYVYTRSAGTWLLTETLTAGDGAAGDFFGSSVAVFDTYLLVGARSDNNGLGANQGSVYVFRKQANNSWTQEAKFSQSDANGSDNFGVSLALSVGSNGATALVGADRHDVAGNSDSGAAYVFFRSGVSWSQQAKLLPNISEAGDRFGTSVSLQGDRAVVGAPLRDSNGADSGSIFIYERSASSWALGASVPGAAAGDLFGQDVAVFGTRVIAGAPNAEVLGNANRGYVRNFVRSGNDWVLQNVLTSQDPQFAAGFGTSVALLSNTYMVGAPLADRYGNTNVGEVTVFNSAVATHPIDRGDSSADDLGGYSLAVSGNTVLYGAPGENLAASGNVGAVYAWVRSSNGFWVIQQKILPITVNLGMFFGSASALDGDMALIGADNALVGGQFSGGVFQYQRSNNSFSFVNQISPSDGATGDRFGYAMALSNNTLAVSAPFANVTGLQNTGAIYVFTRNGNSWTQQAKLTADDLLAANATLGISIALDGDTLLASAPNSGAQNQGLVFVFVRNGSTWTRQAVLSGLDSANGDLFGQGLAIRGNLAVIGAPGDDIGAAANRGSARVFFRSATEWTEIQQYSNPNGEAGDQFGRAVAMTNDAALISANAADTVATPDAGVAYAYARTASGLINAAPIVLSDNSQSAGDFFGYALAADAARAVVGAPNQDSIGNFGNPDQGAAYVFDQLPTDAVFRNGFE